jgi:hypothetical protein
MEQAQSHAALHRHCGKGNKASQGLVALAAKASPSPRLDVRRIPALLEPLSYSSTESRNALHLARRWHWHWKRQVARHPFGLPLGLLSPVKKSSMALGSDALPAVRLDLAGGLSVCRDHMTEIWCFLDNETAHRHIVPTAGPTS